jgi:hypothetical protein
LFIKLYTKNSKGRHILERPRRRWNNNVKIHLKEIRSEVVEWIQLTQERIQCAGSFLHDNKPSDSINVGEFVGQLSDYQLLEDNCTPCS